MQKKIKIRYSSADTLQACDVEFRFYTREQLPRNFTPEAIAAIDESIANGGVFVRVDDKLHISAVEVETTADWWSDKQPKE